MPSQREQVLIKWCTPLKQKASACLEISKKKACSTNALQTAEARFLMKTIKRLHSKFVLDEMFLPACPGCQCGVKIFQRICSITVLSCAKVSGQRAQHMCVAGRMHGLEPLFYCWSFTRPNSLGAFCLSYFAHAWFCEPKQPATAVQCCMAIWCQAQCVNIAVVNHSAPCACDKIAPPPQLCFSFGSLRTNPQKEYPQNARVHIHTRTVSNHFILMEGLPPTCSWGLQNLFNS